MSFIPAEVIYKKSHRLELSDEEIHLFFKSFLEGRVADYQVSAWLMASKINGLTSKETVALTHCMIESGEKFVWPDRDVHVDKHSTGGVGDKTSMILLPLCLLEGVRVPMMAGRGLGHTGGTLDKLESIAGFNVFVNSKQVHDLMDLQHGLIMGQTEKIVPLDRILYSLRDVTATVDSIPLITASIISKKYCEGIGHLVMDVKYGSGAFMQTLEEARQLAHSLKRVAEGLKMNTMCMLTSMNQPLGDRAGNALEIKECVDVLKGAGPDDTTELSIELAAQMVRLVQQNRSLEEIKSSMQANIESGKAFSKFISWIGSQGGDTSKLESHDWAHASIQDPFYAPSEFVGQYISKIDVRELGMAITTIGGNRFKAEDKIDYEVGFSNMKKIGDPIKEDEPLLVIHANDQKKLKQCKQKLSNIFSFSKEASTEPLIKEII